MKASFTLIALIPLLGTCLRAEPLQRFDNCKLVPTEWADGDSFLVEMPDGEEKVFRLYFVDCIETTISSTTDKRRLREQSRYFGIEDYSLVRDYGIRATSFTSKALAEPFTLHTAFADARGRSGKPRYYAFVRTADGRDLARLLVENGLARSLGIGRAMPSGTPRDEWEAYLDDLELVAAMKRIGVWEHSQPDEIIAMRKQEREEMRGLEAVDDALAIRPPSTPINLNKASLEDLVRCGLRESIADAVIKSRPFESVDDLIQVRGIGPVTLEKVRPFLQVD